MSEQTIAIESQSIPRPRLIRWALALTGVVFVGIGGLGVVVPGLPTTIFLIIATWCFARSCPWLEDRLLRNRFFGPFMVFVDRKAPMPPRAKFAAIGVMWLFVGVSIAALTLREGGATWVMAPIAMGACLGTVAVVRWDRGIEAGD